jgi:hypothetical protein
MDSGSAWNEMLDEFRALGGVAENIRLGQGAFGRGLFPIDPSRPIRINIPEELLVSVEHVEIANDVFAVNTESAVGARGRAFLEAYERDFAWGPGRLDVERFLAAMNELPEQLRDLLRTKFDFGRFFHPVSPELVKKWFFSTRMINFRDRQVVMPIVEMANHGGSAKYDIQSGVGLHGLFDGEVFVRYCPTTDPLDMFLNWTFAPKEPIAFSLAIVVPYAGRQLDIRRNFNRETRAPFIPKVEIEDGRIVVEYLLLGAHPFPRVPKGAFRRALAPAKLDDPDEVYDFIQFANRQDMLQLLNALEGVDLAAVPVLRGLALNQLGALSGHFGVRTL